MSTKTEYLNCYNEDDFVERAGEMHELTVTITLCEYRNLITDLVRLETLNKRLEGENTELVNKCERLSEALAACKLPKALERLKWAFSGEDNEDNEDESKGADNE